MRLTRETTAPEGADDGAPTLAVVDARVHEAADATLDFAVSLSRAASGTVTVDYATSDGSATAGADYTAASGTLTFAAGETEKTVSVPVLDDSIDEGEETFTLRLSNATGAHIADGGSVTRHRASPSRRARGRSSRTRPRASRSGGERLRAPRPGRLGLRAFVHHRPLPPLGHRAARAGDVGRDRSRGAMGQRTERWTRGRFGDEAGMGMPKCCSGARGPASASPWGTAARRWSRSAPPGRSGSNNKAVTV